MVALFSLFAASASDPRKKSWSGVGRMGRSRKTIWSCCSRRVLVETARKALRRSPLRDFSASIAAARSARSLSASSSSACLLASSSSHSSPRMSHSASMVALESGIGGGESAFAGGVLDASDGWNHFGQARNLVALVPRLSAPDVPTTAPVGSLTATGLEEAGPAMARAPTPGHTARTVAVGICTACYRMAHLDFLGRATSTARVAAELTLRASASIVSDRGVATDQNFDQKSKLLNRQTPRAESAAPCSPRRCIQRRWVPFRRRPC